LGERVVINYKGLVFGKFRLKIIEKYRIKEVIPIINFISIDIEFASLIAF